MNSCRTYTEAEMWRVLCAGMAIGLLLSLAIDLIGFAL